jgi:tetratricopeptide (TPR) repeat protein
MERLDAQSECLERARRRFVAAVSLMKVADVDAMTRAEEVVASLPDVAMCMRSDAALDSDVVAPEQQDQHALLLAEIDRAATDSVAGRAAAAKATLDDVIPQLGDFPHALVEARRLRADADLALGRRTDAIAELGEAVALGHTLGDRDALATTMTSLARALARASAGSDEARRILAIARAIGEDLQWSESRMLALTVIELEIAFHAEQHDEVDRLGAQLLASAALESSRQVQVRSLLATTLERRGRLDDALAAHDATLAFVEALRGPDHPEVASVLAERARVLTAMTRYPDSTTSLQRALVIRLAVNGAQAPVVGETERLLGDVELKRLRNDEALAHYERAIAIHRAANDDIGLSLALSNASTVYDDLYKHAKAAELQDEALAAAERAFGPSSPTVARMLVNRGLSRYAAGEIALGAAEHERALAIFAATLPADDPTPATARLGLSRFLAALGRADEAVAMFEVGRRGLEAKFPHDRPRAVALAYNFALILDVVGRPEQALVEWRAMHELAERTLPAEHLLRLEMLIDYGKRLLEARAHADAARVLEMARDLGARLEDPRTDAIAADLARARRGA